MLHDPSSIIFSVKLICLASVMIILYCHYRRFSHYVTYYGPFHPLSRPMEIFLEIDEFVLHLLIIIVKVRGVS